MKRFWWKSAPNILHTHNNYGNGNNGNNQMENSFKAKDTLQNTYAHSFNMFIFHIHTLTDFQRQQQTKWNEKDDRTKKKLPKPREWLMVKHVFILCYTHEPYK